MIVPGWFLLPMATAVVLSVAACGPTPGALSYRAFSDHYAFRIDADPVPPMAREKARFKIVVRDKSTGQPIQNGEGVLYAENRDGLKTWDTLEPGKELGTYYANLNFLIAGQWAMGMQFRRDSLHALEKVDWMQEVVPDTSKIP